MAELAWHFGVPDLPPIRHISYCAMSEWAYERVKELRLHDTSSHSSAPLTPFVGAAVLEEMYIY